MTDGGLFPIKEDKVIIGQRARQILRCCRTDEKEENPMRQLVFALCLFASPALAELEQARDMMEAGEFEAAREELLPRLRELGQVKVFSFDTAARLEEDLDTLAPGTANTHLVQAVDAVLALRP